GQRHAVAIGEDFAADLFLDGLGGEHLHRQGFDLVLPKLLQDVPTDLGAEGDQQDGGLLFPSHGYLALPALSSAIQVRIKFAIMAGSFFAIRTNSFSMRACSGSTSGIGSAASCSAESAFASVSFVSVTSLISIFSAFGRLRRSTIQIIPTTSSGPS